MAQKIYSEAHRLIPMVSPRIVSHVDTLVQPENLIDKCRQSSSTLGDETCPRNRHETPKLRPQTP